MDAETLSKNVRDLLASEPQRKLLWQSALVPPRRVRCYADFNALKGWVEVWIVLDTGPGGYFVFYDEERSEFGLAAGDPEQPFIVHWDGSLFDTLDGM